MIDYNKKYFCILLHGDFMRKCFFLFVILTILVSTTVVNASNESSYIIYDVNTQAVIEGKNYEKTALIASTSKILTAIVALENRDLFDLVKIEYSDTQIEGSKLYIKEGESFTVLDLLYGLMLRSGNDCANALARSYVGGYDEFITLMNDKCKELGMINSIFENPSGLDCQNENHSTAYDMAKLMAYAVKNDFFRQIASTHETRIKSQEGTTYYLKNKDKSVLSDERFICGKTGYTKRSGRILVNYARAYSRNVVIVTINDPNDWQNHKAFLNSLEKYIDYNILYKGRYRVPDNDMIIELLDDIKIPLIKNEKNNYYYVIDVNNNMLEVYYNGLIIIRCKINIVQDV